MAEADKEQKTTTTKLNKLYYFLFRLKIIRFVKKTITL